jgi:hypothetical protein
LPYDAGTTSAEDAMRYLRMFTNSVVGGALGAAYVTLVMLQLNPQYPLAPAPLASLYLTLLAF